MYQIACSLKGTDRPRIAFCRAKGFFLASLAIMSGASQTTPSPASPILAGCMSSIDVPDVVHSEHFRGAPGKLARSSRWKSGTGKPQQAPGSQCCAVDRRRRLRSVHSNRVGCAIQPRKVHFAEAETVTKVEGNTSGSVMRGIVALPWSENTSRPEGTRRNLGGLGPGRTVIATGPTRGGKTRSRSRR